MKFKCIHILILMSVSALFLTGCESKQIEKYRVKKENLSGAKALQASSQDSLKFEKPTLWQALKVEGIRKAAFSIQSEKDKAEVSVISLPGDAGGLISNVNRWRGQLGLEPESETSILKALKPISIQKNKGHQITLFSSDESEGMIVALVNVKGQSWFFKLKGSSQIVKAQQKDFEAFLNSVKFPDKNPQPNQNSINNQAVSEEILTIIYQKPSDWVEEEVSGMRVASFTAGKEDNKVQISVIPLKGDAGGIVDNINRWRGQVELSPEDDKKMQNRLSQIKIDGDEGYLVNIINQEKNQAMTVSLINKGGETWFFKMSGNVQGVKAQDKSFKQFMNSIKFVKNTPNEQTEANPVTPSGFTFKTPSGWTQQSASGMRKASFKIGVSAELSVISLPGDAGGLVSNINRWRNQVGLKSLSESEVMDSIKTMTIDKVKGFKTELISPDKQSAILVALTNVEGNSWFFKLTGHPDILKEERQKFDQFLQSIHFNKGENE